MSSSDKSSIAVDAFFVAFEKFVDAIQEAERRGLLSDDDLDLAADELVEAAVRGKEAGVEWLSTDTAELRELLRQRREKRGRQRAAEAS